MSSRFAIFVEPIQVECAAFDFSEVDLPRGLRRIRILLPAYQEFHLVSRRAGESFHPVANARAKAGR